MLEKKKKKKGELSWWSFLFQKSTELQPCASLSGLQHFQLHQHSSAVQQEKDGQPMMASIVHPGHP